MGDPEYGTQYQKDGGWVDRYFFCFVCFLTESRQKKADPTCFWVSLCFSCIKTKLSGPCRLFEQHLRVLNNACQIRQEFCRDNAIDYAMIRR